MVVPDTNGVTDEDSLLYFCLVAIYFELLISLFLSCFL